MAATGTHFEIIASSRQPPRGSSISGSPSQGGGALPPPRPPRGGPPPPAGLAHHLPAPSPTSSRTPSPLNTAGGGSSSSSSRALQYAPAPPLPVANGHRQPPASAAAQVKQSFYASLPGAPPLLPPASSSSPALRAPAGGAHPPGLTADDDDDDDGGSDASSFHDEELVDLGSSSEDEFVGPPFVVRPSSTGIGGGGGGESSAESLGVGARETGKAPSAAAAGSAGGVRDWLGVPGVAPLTTHDLPPRQSSAPTHPQPAPPPRTSSVTQPISLPPSARNSPPPSLRSRSHGRTPSLNDQLRRELPALHTQFNSPVEHGQQQHQQPQQALTDKEREHLHYQQLQAQQAKREGGGSSASSPPPYVHSPPGAAGTSPVSRPKQHQLQQAEHDDVHAHRDGYTNSPSLFRLPDHLGGPTARLSPSTPVGLGGLLEDPSTDGGGKLFDPASFTLASPSPSSGLIATLLGSPAALRTLLQELPIKDVLSFWRALPEPERRKLEGSRAAVEEVRVWALGWAGYVRGALDGVGGREGWDRVGWTVLLDFAATLLEPPTTAFPPAQVLAISLATLLLRASHARLPPPGPHLIPFEEEDVLPPPLQPTLAALNPKTRMRGLPAGRLLVLPSPLAGAPPPPPVPSGSQSAIDGRPPFSTPGSPRLGGGRPSAGGGSIRARRSSISESVGIHWGASRARTNGSAPPPSAFGLSTAGGGLGGQPKLAPSSASIYSVDNHSKVRLAPPPPRLPEPRRYEFPQPAVGQPGRRHRRQASDSQSIMSTATTSFGNGAGGGPGAPSMHRQRGVSAGPPSASGSHHMLAHGISSPDLANQQHRAWLADPTNAPPNPAFARPLRKSSSKDSSWTSLDNATASSSGRGGGGGSTSATASVIGGKWETTSSSESSSGRITRRRSDQTLVEPLFLSLTSPFKYGRAPLVRVVVPLPSDMSWPSGPALKLCHRHLDHAGLLAKMKIGDLVENLAVSWRTRTAEGPAGTGWTTGTMVFIPPFLHPLSTTHAAAAAAAQPSTSAASTATTRMAHLPASLNMFLLPPTYYHGVIPPPYIIYLDLLPFAPKIVETLRLANQRAEVLSAGGDVLSLDQWVYEAGFYIAETADGGPWDGTMVTLEADGTKEGKDEILRRVDGSSAKRRPWEVVAAKSTRGSVWLKLVRETLPTTA